MSGTGSDDEGAGAGSAHGGAGADGLDLGVLAAAAASLARQDVHAPSGSPAAREAGAAPTRTRRRKRAFRFAPRAALDRRRWAVPAEVLVVAGLGLGLVVFAGVSATGPGLSAGPRGPVDGGIGPGEGSLLTEVAGEVVTTAPPGSSSTPSPAAPDQPAATSAPQPPSTPQGAGPVPPTSMPASPSPPNRPPSPPPPTTSSTTSSTTSTVPAPSVRATDAAVVSCTSDGGVRTLVYSYVLTGSAADGPYEAVASAPGRVVVATVVAPLPGGGSTTVALEPGPVECA